MFVLEKTRAIGILNALGAGESMIRRVFLFHGIFIAFTGILSGNILAFVICWLQKEMHLISIPSEIYFMENVPILMNVENFLIVSGVAFILCMVTTFIPARLAAKLDTVTLLRFG
jgi:lipoprotein-releasing system permease protein